MFCWINLKCVIVYILYVLYYILIHLLYGYICIYINVSMLMLPVYLAMSFQEPHRRTFALMNLCKCIMLCIHLRIHVYNIYTYLYIYIYTILCIYMYYTYMYILYCIFANPTCTSNTNTQTTSCKLGCSSCQEALHQQACSVIFL